MGHLSRAEFERVVEEALESLPERFAKLVNNVVITVEDDKASVRVDDLIDGHEKEVQAVCLIPLPAGADGSDIRVTLGAPGARRCRVTEAAPCRATVRSL